MEDRGSISAKGSDILAFLYGNEVKFPASIADGTLSLASRSDVSEAYSTGADSTFLRDRSTKREGDNSPVFGGEVKVNIRCKFS
jgi:hypothetical protein